MTLTQVLVDISDFKVSSDPDSVLVTYALGSCIAVMLHDPTRLVGGMIHYMLPFSSIAPAKAEARPAMFADTGIPLLFRAMYGMGCRKENIVARVAGGGALYNDKGMFEIGKRNYVALRKIFWKNGVLITSEDVGGAKSRTARLYVTGGRATITVNGEECAL